MKRRRAKKTTRKILKVLLPAALLLLIGITVLLSFVLYRAMHPQPAAEGMNPAHFMLRYEEVSWRTRDGYILTGWWIPAKKKGPAIVLAPGYGMGRAGALSLAAILNDPGFNVLIFDPRAGGAAPRGSSTFGILEAEDLLEGLDYLQGKSEVDPRRLGVWGVDVGAWAALMAASRRPEVRAVVADCPYGAVEDFLVLQLRDVFGLRNAYIETACTRLFGLYRWFATSNARDRIPLDQLSDKKILFLLGDNRPEVVELSRRLMEEMDPRPELATMAVSRVRLMKEDELKKYDATVAGFFARNLAQEKSAR